jgi:putative nucleotidyltransferase with HDIG domain
LVNLLGISYRFLQFQRALFARPTPNELALAERALTPALFRLFLQIQPNEQAHSLNVFNALRAEGHTDPDFLSAALLHDIGKSHFPLRIWERVAIVLAMAIFPNQAKRWGESQPVGWKRPFVVARQHPAWGAEMADRAGASYSLIELIRRHQDALPSPPTTPLDQVLIHLKRHDDQT